MPNLDTSIEYLKGVGPARAQLLRKELRIYTFGDLLLFFPLRYIDKSKFYTVREIASDEYYVQLRGRIVHVREEGEGRGRRMIATFRDHTGDLELIWFKGLRWIRGKFSSGVEYVVYGKPSRFNGRYNITHPEVEPLAGQEQNSKVPFHPHYSSTEKLKLRGITPRVMQKMTWNLMQVLNGAVVENLNEQIISSLNLLLRHEALYYIHFPSSDAILQRARFRLKFEELFFIQLDLLKQKYLRMERVHGIPFTKIGGFFNGFFHHNLPFELTGAQKRVLREIRIDVGGGHQMNRLLQGDVGSGKTLVGLMSMLMALDNGHQASMMAPTEILAQQHFKSISKLVQGLDIEVRILTGSTKAKERRQIHQGLLDGSVQILIGTHALIEDTVQFKSLGLVIIDEQHRFGVAQRARLWKKNQTPPHILVMTATPIPRTLSMTLYGDLEVSVIDELPPGRKPVKTVHYTDAQRLKVFGFMRQQIALGRQVYVVYPLIKESEKLDLKDLMDGYESIARDFPLPQYAVSVVHGKLKPTEKEYEMQRFVNGETQIMVATTVIEVGVDVPNASVMVIENAERFGLSQLHQLRGRVGRGADQSFCILMSSYKLSADGKKRLDTMVRTADGFEIAQADLELRGPGDIQGTQQSGMLELKIADLIQDEKLMRHARALAIEILDNDPALTLIKNQPLLRYLHHLHQSKTDWSRIS